MSNAQLTPPGVSNHGKDPKWAKGTAYLSTLRNVTSHVMHNIRIRKMLPLVLCVVAIACSQASDLPPPAKGVQEPGAQPGHRPASGDLQSGQIACRGFLVLCPMWTVYWVQARPRSSAGDKVSP